MKTLAAVLIALSLSGCAAAMLAVPLIEPVVEGAVRGLMDAEQPQTVAPAK